VTQSVFKLPRVFQDIIEHAAIILGLLGGACATGGAEQTLKDQTRVNFFGDRRRFAPPGDIRRVGAAIARVAVAGLLSAVATQLQRGKLCLRADLFGGELIDGNADANIRAMRFLGLTAGQETRQAAGMITGAVAVGSSLV